MTLRWCFLSLGEIASARLVKERVETPDATRPGATQTQYLRYVELELSGDPAPLADALQAELGEQAPSGKTLVWHQFDSLPGLSRQHVRPVDHPHTLGRRAGAQKFLDALRPYTVIADPVSSKQDFTHLQSLSREDQQKQLRELVARGQNVTAIYAARKLYGGTLGEAKQMVDSLRENKTPQQR